MRIVIDARFYGSVGKGLGRYTQKLIENLENISSRLGADKKDEFLILLRKENYGEYDPREGNFKKILADYQWYTLGEQIKLPLLLNKLDADMVHFPHFNVPFLYRKKYVVTIHDLILLHFPTVRGTILNPIVFYLKFLAYRLVIRLAIKRAKKVIAVSQFTRNDIIKHYPFARDKVAVTYEACDEFCWINNSNEVLNKYGIIKPYILYVGNAYPHKNLPALISAFQDVKKQFSDLRLVLVGREDYFFKKIRDFAGRLKVDDVIFTGYVSDCELDCLYRNARLYVFPSLYEGFGLPPLEAMAKGVPVVSSDHPCMKEILGDSAYFCNAGKPENLSSALKKLLSDQPLRGELSQKGYDQIKKYSWPKMAEETFEIYHSNSI